jgi:hypothetical protein
MRQRCSAHQEKMDLHSSIIPADNVKFRKGLYVSLACTQCRANHRRCNGQAPCSRCEKANLDCIYTKTRPRGGNRSKKNQHNNDKNIYDNDDSSPDLSSECILTVPDSTINLKMIVNFYSNIYYQTPDFQMSPFVLPNPDNLLMPEQKFCILSSVSYAALVLGQLSQGKLFMDQAKYGEFIKT